VITLYSLDTLGHLNVTDGQTDRRLMWHHRVLRSIAR